MSGQQSAHGDVAHGPTHVVTCFLLRRDRGRDEVLLARRSERVRTYRGAWGAISGYVEPQVAPLEQAYQEIREETGLQQGDVTLLREGETLAFRDETIGQDWVVHPFLFVALRPEAAQHDWEAHEFAWTAPTVVTDLQTVPLLAEALARVYPPVAG
jgi:8-oxo-dGTP pyrophosphatase MutT (NUDIX family)